MAPLVLNVKEKPEIGILCEICSTEMVERHCKLVCINCGFMWDCSDH